MKKTTEESAEAFPSALGIPSRSQVVGIARQLVDLEDRIEGLDERMSALMAKVHDVFRALADHEPVTSRRRVKKGRERNDRTDC